MGNKLLYSLIATKINNNSENIKLGKSFPPYKKVSAAPVIYRPERRSPSLYEYPLPTGKYLSKSFAVTVLVLQSAAAGTRIVTADGLSGTIRLSLGLLTCVTRGGGLLVRIGQALFLLTVLLAGLPGFGSGLTNLLGLYLLLKTHSSLKINSGSFCS